MKLYFSICEEDSGNTQNFGEITSTSTNRWVIKYPLSYSFHGNKVFLCVERPYLSLFSHLNFHMF